MIILAGPFSGLFYFCDMKGTITKATLDDLQELNRLINRAYRGESSKQGWTTEADLLDGIRTSEESLAELINKEDGIILKYVQEERILGCVNLQQQGEHLYLGMLTVTPDQQDKGIGKQLLFASEQYALDKGYTSIIMTVITARNELLQWYQRHGYRQTGERKPFPMNDPRFGLPKQPLEFFVLQKTLSHNSD